MRSAYRLILLAAALLGCERSDRPLPRMTVSLLQRLPNGELAPAYGPLIPSIPCPEIRVTNFDLTNLRKDPRNEYTYICDIVVSGVVTSSLCDVIPKDQGVIDEVRFYHNDGDQAIATFAVTGDKGLGKDLGRPFPFDGKFDFRANAVSVSEGNNTFRIVARDKVYGLDGYSLWAASFTFPHHDDQEENERAKEPTVTKRPQFVAGGGGGELALFCFALTGERSSENLALIAGVKQDAVFHFKALPASDRLVPVWPGTSSPAFFTVRPTMRIAPKVPSDAMVTSSMTSAPELASLSPRERFLYGLAQGLGFEGFDLVFDSDNVVFGGAGLSKDFKRILMAVELADAAGGRRRAEVLVRPHREFSSNLATNTNTTPGLLWHFAHLFRTSDPMADDLVISLLLGDLSGVGLKGVSIADWRDGFYMCFSELLEALIKETMDESELNQGYYLGRGVADALRTTVDPTQPARLDEIGKAEFLSRMKKMPFFNPRGRADIALKKAGKPH